MPDDAPEARGPVTEAERIASIDVLRGVAVLGILVMNVRDFAMPLRSFDNPGFPDGFRWSNFVAWVAGNLFFEDKMIAIFSMLFGAGIVIFTDRAAARGAPVASLYYRRHFWLLVFGLIHAYLFWFGDILTTYAVCGMVLFAARKLSPRVLLIGGFLVFSVAILFRQWPGVYESIARFLFGARTRPPMSAEAAYHGSWLDLYRWRAWLNWYWHVEGAFGYDFWRCSGFMMAGMGMLKLGIFDATRSSRFYRNLMLWGWGVGLPLAGFAIHEEMAENPGMAKRFGVTSWAPVQATAMLLASAAVALGHVGLVMQVCRVDLLPRARGALAATGRMALTNYLGQTLVCVLVFDGWAFGRWGPLWHRGAARAGRRHLARAADREPDLAPPFPVRADGMALAVADLLAPATDADPVSPGKRRNRPGIRSGHHGWHNGSVSDP